MGGIPLSSQSFDKPNVKFSLPPEKVAEYDSRFGTVKVRPKPDEPFIPYPAEADYSFLNKGVVRSKPDQLKSFVSKSGTSKVAAFQEVDSSTLKIQRGGRVISSATAFGLNAVGAGLLSYFGGKMLLNTATDQDNSETYKRLGQAFSFTVIPGIATGFALESGYYGVGSVFMSIFSNFLDKPWGLPLFSVFDGLHSLGYSQVRYREEKNAFSVQNSIFNSESMKMFEFLRPVEQSIVDFWSKVKKPKLFLTDEPYSTCNAAGGGLIVAGAALGVKAVFGKFLPEKVKELPYLFYSAFSSLFLVSLFRDGKVINWRAKKFQGNKPGQKESKLLEGWLKMVSAPILLLNNGILALKGLGLDSGGNKLYDFAMGFRGIGAGLAMLAFGTQGAYNFFKPSKFGPILKEKIKLLVNPIKAWDALKEIFSEYKTFPDGKAWTPIGDEANARLDGIVDNDSKYGDFFKGVSGTETMERLMKFAQTGLPNPSNDYSHDRQKLDRYTHCRQVAAVGITLFDQMLEKAQSNNDKELADYLLKYELAFKTACLVHDVGHCARSHVTEKAVPGLDNDEHSLELVCGKDANGNSVRDLVLHEYLSNAENYREMVQANPEDYKPLIIDIINKHKVANNQPTISEDTDIKTLDKKLINMAIDQMPKDTISKITEIFGRNHPLFKLMKDADRLQYQTLGDFITVNGQDPRLEFPEGSVEDVKEFANKIRVYEDGGAKKIGYTADGAIQKLIREYNRLVFDVMYNGNVLNYGEGEMIYCLGLSAAIQKHPTITFEDFQYMSQDEVDKYVEEGLSEIKKGQFPVEVKLEVGGESYSGYHPDDPKNKIVVVHDDGKKEEVLHYIERVVKKDEPDLYKYLVPKIQVLTTQREVRLKAIISPEFDFNGDISGASAQIQNEDESPVLQPAA